MPAGQNRPPDPAALRRDYHAPAAGGGLTEGDLAPTWHAQFARWFGDAVRAGLHEPNAVVLATASPDAVPSARTVLLKGFDARGFVVFTNLTSRKGREVTANPHAALVFPWMDAGRQVVVSGDVELVSAEETEAYFRTRPRGAQIGAWTSRQSEVIESREVLERRRAELAKRFADVEVPVPPFWGGLRIRPVTVEFWQGRPDRLHDRLRFRSVGDEWVVERLAP